jgi:hypothetical protein
MEEGRTVKFTEYWEPKHMCPVETKWEYVFAQHVHSEILDAIDGQEISHDYYNQNPLVVAFEELIESLEAEVDYITVSAEHDRDLSWL